MAIDFSKSYPVIEWDLNNHHFFSKYFGKTEENSRGFKVQILQDGEVLSPTTETLRIYCKKKDGTNVYINSNSVVDDYYIIDLTEQVFAIPGLVECELQLNSGGIWMYSPTFGINVDDSLIDASILSTDDFMTLRDALSKIDRTITTDNVANNLITTTEGLVLDARQGKALQDQVSTLNNNLGDFSSQLAEKASKQEVEIERQRINTITRLEEGSTTADAELIDIRNGADGIVYATAGEAVRNVLTAYMTTADKEWVI